MVTLKSIDGRQSETTERHCLGLAAVEGQEGGQRKSERGGERMKEEECGEKIRREKESEI